MLGNKKHFAQNWIKTKNKQKNWLIQNYNTKSTWPYCKHYQRSIQLCNKSFFSGRGYTGHMKNTHKKGKYICLELQWNKLLMFHFFITEFTPPKIPNWSIESVVATCFTCQTLKPLTDLLLSLQYVSVVATCFTFQLQLAEGFAVMPTTRNFTTGCSRGRELK